MGLTTKFGSPAPVARLFTVSVLPASVPSVETASGPRPAFRDATTAAFATVMLNVAFGSAAVPFAATVPETVPSAPRSGLKAFASAAGTAVSFTVRSRLAPAWPETTILPPPVFRVVLSKRAMPPATLIVVGAASARSTL